MTQESENKLARRVEDKRAAVPLQWNDPANATPAAAAAAANQQPAQREVPEFTGLDTMARMFADVANGEGKVVLSAQSCDLLLRALTTPIVAPLAPAVQAQAELTDEAIDEVWNAMPGGADGWLKQFGYRQFARSIARHTLVRVAASMAGTIRPTDDELWEQTIGERDYYHDMADKLAEAVAKHFGADIGEHSNMNCPWMEALYVIETDDRSRSAAREQARNEALEPESMSTDEAREYLVKFMEQHFTDKTFHRYIRGDETRASTLAGDFAWQMARALRMIEAPAASKEGDAA